MVTCISDNAKSTEHVTGLFINSSKSVKKTKLCSCKEARQLGIFKIEISNLHWNPKLPVSSLHRISHSESSLLENLILTNIYENFIVYKSRIHLHSHFLSSLQLDVVLFEEHCVAIAPREAWSVEKS